MKILAFSDLHLSHAHARPIVEASQTADLVIAAGDLCGIRQGLDEAMTMLAAISAPILTVPGNVESEAELRAAALQNMTVLHGQGHEVAGLRVFGLGYAVPPPPFGDWSCNLTEDEAEAMLAPCKATDILITHSPPKGIGDVTSGGLSVGSTAVRNTITRLQPQLALCGHIHESWGQSGRIGATPVHNLGPTPNWFDIAPCF